MDGWMDGHGLGLAACRLGAAGMSCLAVAYDWGFDAPCFLVSVHWFSRSGQKQDEEYRVLHYHGGMRCIAWAIAC